MSRSEPNAAAGLAAVGLTLAAPTAAAPVRAAETIRTISEATLGGVTGDVVGLFDGTGARPLTATGGYLQRTP